MSTPPFPTVPPPRIPTPPTTRPPGVPLAPYFEPDFASGLDAFGEAGNITNLDFKTEEEACLFFDEFVSRSDAFEIFKEVKGTYIQPRFGTEHKPTARIDRILVPKAKAIQAGWDEVIGVEIKTSGVKVGPPIAQILDYNRVGFETRMKGVLFVPTWIFLFPMLNPHRGLESVMRQHRIGNVVYHPHSGEMTFQGSGNLIVIDSHGTITAKANAVGNRRGSR